jgi:hypothetical protein
MQAERGRQQNWQTGARPRSSIEKDLEKRKAPVNDYESKAPVRRVRFSHRSMAFRA